MNEAWDLASALGYAGVLANIAWLLMRRRVYLLAGQVVACAFMAAHFILLSAYTGAAIMLVAGFQAALAIPLGTHPRFKVVYLASLLLTPFLCIATWQGVESVFSSLVLVLVCIANYQLTEVRQRSWLILGVLVWVVHNILIGSVPALTSNVIALAVSGYMLWRAIRLKSSLAAAW